MDNKSDILISVKNLYKYFYGNPVLRGIDLQVKSGEMVSIIGRSGCGKTTLLRCLNCLEILDSGTINIAGITLNRKPAKDKRDFNNKVEAIRRKVGMPFQSLEETPSLDEDFQIKAHTLRSRVGMLFQSLNLFPNLTVLDNITKAPIIVKGISKSEAIDNAIKILDKVGMAKFTERYPHQLSGSQSQRVAIARALAMNPQVMLYDEPTSALDPELVEEVTEIMRNLHDEGMTQIIVTHAMKFAKSASDTIVYMEQGQIVESGTPFEIFNNPKDSRTRRYLKIVEE